MRPLDALMRVTNASALVTCISPSFTPMTTRLPRSLLMMPWSLVSPFMTTLLVRYHAHLIPLEELILSQVLRNNVSVMPRENSLLKMILDSISNTGESKAHSQCRRSRFPHSSPKLSKPLSLRRLSLRLSKNRIPALMLFQHLAKSATTIALPIPKRL